VRASRPRYEKPRVAGRRSGCAAMAAAQTRKEVALVPINISTRHGHISDSTQARIVEKLEKLPRFYDRITGIELTIDLEHRDVPKLDLRVTAKDKHDFVAAEESGELISSVDLLVEKLEHQLRKHKEKLLDRHRTPGHRHEDVAESSAETGDAA
jgi:putative sigma-54 modulation protein